MKLPIIFMFSGQGSHYYQMGKNLFDNNDIFKRWMLKSDKCCQDILGFSVIDHLYDENNVRSQSFSKTLLTHPAIFMVEHALLQVLLETNIQPDFVLGASMGEFIAAVASRIISFEDALQLVIKQAQLLEQHCLEGEMLAILNNCQLYHTNSYLNQVVELAAINFSSHFVVSGRSFNLKEIEKKLKEKNITSQRLAVTHGFHSTLIDPAKAAFLNIVECVSLNKSSIPYISCSRADTLFSLKPEYFWEIIRLPIQFEKTIQYLENKQPHIYFDLSPSGTLATFVKYNLTPDSKSKYISVMKLDGQDTKNFALALNKLMELKNE